MQASFLSPELGVSSGVTVPSHMQGPVGETNCPTTLDPPPLLSYPRLGSVVTSFRWLLKVLNLYVVFILTMFVKHFGQLSFVNVLQQ